GVDHVVIGLVRARSSGFGLFLAGLVHGFAQLHGRLGQGGGLFLDRFRVLAFDGGLGLGDGGLDFGLYLGRDLVPMLLERGFGGMHEAFGLVAGFDRFAALLVHFRIGFGVLDHLFDVGVRQAARGLDAD